MYQSIIEQHAQEAAFLWSRHDHAAGAAHYDLAALCTLDERIEAHLDGLRVAAAKGFHAAMAALDAQGPGEVFVAAAAALERRDLKGLAYILDLAEQTPGLVRGLISALGWVSYSVVAEVLPGLLDPECPPALRRIGIAACVAHRQNPGPALESAMFDEELRLKARALRAIGELGRVDLLRDIALELTSENDGCRFSSAWAASLLGEARATEVLWSFATAKGSVGERAASVALRRVDPKTGAEWIRALACVPDHTRAALVGAGALGEPSLVDWLVECMANPEHARVAGESFSMITGTPIAGAFAAPAPPQMVAQPNEDPNDDGVALDPDEPLAWPNPDAIRALWKTMSPGLKPRNRYLLGKPITRDWALSVLREGAQPRRAAAAIELSLLTPGRPLFDTRAPGFRQQTLLDG